MTTKKRRRMNKFEITEISAVDRPAQSGAKMVIMKRADRDLEIKKGPALTTSVDGHSHLIWDSEEEGGHTSWVETGEGGGHSHPWVRTVDGEIIIGEAEGHTHTIVNTLFKSNEFQPKAETKSDKGGPITKSTPADTIGSNTKESPNMTGKVAKTADDRAAENQALQDQLTIAKSLAELNDLEKQHYNSLDEDGKTAFLTKSVEERKTLLEMAKSADPVVYTSDSGEQFRKSDDPRLVRMAKQADEDRKTATQEIEKRQNLEFAKRADEELGHLPGEVSTKVAVLKALDGIKDEKTRTEAMSLLKANNEGMAKAFETKGSSGGDAGGSAQEKLDALAKKYANDHKISFEKAYGDVLDTSEGKALYDSTLNK